MINNKGFFQEVSPQEEDTYLVFIRQMPQHQRLLELSLQLADGGLFAKLKDYRTDELLLKRYQPFPYQPAGELSFLIPPGKWYCGEDDRLVEIGRTSVTMEGETFEIAKDFQMIDQQRIRPYFFCWRGKAGNNLSPGPYY